MRFRRRALSPGKAERRKAHACSLWCQAFYEDVSRGAQAFGPERAARTECMRFRRPGLRPPASGEVLDGNVEGQFNKRHPSRVDEKGRRRGNTSEDGTRSRAIRLHRRATLAPPSSVCVFPRASVSSHDSSPKGSEPSFGHRLACHAFRASVSSPRAAPGLDADGHRRHRVARPADLRESRGPAGHPALCAARLRRRHRLLPPTAGRSGWKTPHGGGGSNRNVVCAQGARAFAMMRGAAPRAWRQRLRASQRLGSSSPLE